MATHITVDISGLQNKIKDLKALKSNVMPDAYRFLVSVTPVNSGNARSKTTLTSENDINGSYQYADVLDQGRHMTSKGMRGSLQAPDGMSKPTITYLKQLIERYIKKVGSK